MVKGLSNKVVYFILALLAFAGGGGYLVYDYVIPEREQVERQLATTKSAVQAKYDEVARMKEEFVLLQSQLRTFKDLEARGFFNDQDRATAIENFSKLSTRVGILKAKLKFDAGAIVPNDMADLASQIVVKSRGTVDIESLDDVDVYSLVKFMQERFPGSVDITKVSLERAETLNAAMLRQIGSGKPVPMIKGDFEFDWRTMTSNNSTAPAAGGK